MANVVGDIAISIGADIAPLVRDLGKAQGQVSKFGAAAQGSASGGMALFARAGTAMAAAVTAAAAGLIALTKNAIDSAGALHDASIKTGVQVAQLQAMSQVAEEASVSSESLISALSKMQNNIASLQAGTKSQVDAFGALGLSMGALQGKSPDEQFALIAQSLTNIQDPAERTAAAMNIFGKTGADLIPMMDGYAASLADVAENQKKFGITLTQDQAKLLDDLGDSLGRLTMAAQGLGMQMAVTFGPALLSATEAITASLKDWVDLFERANDALTTTDVERKFNDIKREIDDAAASAEGLAFSLEWFGDGKISQELRKEADGLRMMTDAFHAGAMSSDEYKTRVKAAFDRINDLLRSIGDVNNTNLTDAIGEMDKYASSILKALGLADKLSQIKIGAQASSSSGDLTLIPDSGNGGTVGVKPGVTPPATVVVSSSGSGGGSGGGGNNLANDLKSLQDSLMSETELADAAYAERLKKLEEFRQAKLLTEQEYNDLEAKTTQDHQESIASIEQKAMDAKLSSISGAFGDLSGLMQTHNKSLFEVGKKAAIASAIVDGYSAATSAWEKGMKVGGPPVAAAFTAASLIKTGALISGIQSTQFGSTGAGNSGGGSATAPAQAPLQASLSLVGTGDYVRKTDLGSLLTMLNKEAGDRGYTIMVPA